MNRKMRIIGGCSIAACLLLLLSSCATAPGRGITLEAARETLQTQYPDLLQTFDLHQGIFSVDGAVWDTLSRAHRSEFLDRCLQSRRTVTGQAPVRVLVDGDLVAIYNEASSVFYGDRFAVAADDAGDASREADSAAVGSKTFLLLLSLPRPVYPAEALQAGIEGTVYVQARIGLDGRVQEVMAVDGGISALNGAALDAARKARFRPFPGEEESESIWVRIPMQFAIQAAGTPLTPRMRGSSRGIVDVMTPPEPDRSLSAGGGK